LIDDSHYEEIYKIVDDLLNKKSDYIDFYDYKFGNARIGSNINYYFCLLREKWLTRAK